MGVSEYANVCAWCTVMGWHPIWDELVCHALSVSRIDYGSTMTMTRIKLLLQMNYYKE